MYEIVDMRNKTSFEEYCKQAGDFSQEDVDMMWENGYERIISEGLADYNYPLEVKQIIVIEPADDFCNWYIVAKGTEEVKEYLSNEKEESLDRVREIESQLSSL